VVTPSAPPPPSIGISPAAPTVTEVSGQTPVTFTVSLTSAATVNTVVDYAVSATAIDGGKTYFNAAAFGGTLPSGTLTILAGQSQAQFTVDVPDSALGTTPDKWLAVAISTPGADPIYAANAQVDVINETPVAGVAAQPLLEYVPGNAIGATENAPSLTQSGSSYVLNLGNVVQGTSVAALQFALANMASAPADGLSALSLGASGSGFNVAGLGSATLISAGNSVTAVTVQPLTANLGAQSTLVTLGATDVNATGYAGTLPQITLTVTENVIAAAQAAVSTSAIALPDVRVGSSDSQTITVTNTAAAGAAPLDVTLAAAAGATASGAINQLAAGASDSTSLPVGLATTTAGLQSGFVTLNLASDLGNGVSAPLPLNKSVTLTGSVYRAAAATITQSATVVHVGDTASQTLSIANSDPADGYSEGLRATVTGDTGNIVASGTTGLIAAGTSDTSSVTVSYSTATAGVVSGQINLGLTSDGTGVDSLAPISLGTDVTPFSVQVDNYATADLHETSGGGTLTGTAATGYTLDLGTIGQGSGPDTIGLAALNAASGLADLLAGSFAITGDSAFTNSGFAGFSGLGAGQADTALSVSLSTQNDGMFSETITLTGTGSNASGYSGTVAPVKLTIEGQVSSETPVLAGGTVSGAITELAATTGSSALDTAQGTIDFTDANLTASHTASVLSVAASGVTTGLPGNGTLLSLLSLGSLAEDTASNPGSVTWNFAAADSTFDYLAAGETLTLTYAVQIAETGGRSATQNVTVTVTGTNDLPQIAAGTTASATLTEIVAGPHNPVSDTASGTIRFTDADLSDTHTASVVSVSASGATTGLAGNATLLGLLTTAAPTEPSGATAGSVGWNFAAPDATFAYLMPGQTVTLTYTVDVSDNHGGTVAQAVTVNVTGAPGKVVHSATGGTISGLAYASADNAYTAANFRYLETFYDASGNILATETFATNGGYAVTIGGVVTLSKTVNADGSYVLHYAGPGTILGTTYASSDNSHTAAGALDAQTFYDASGKVVATETYQPNGGYTVTTGGVVRLVRTGNGDGSYDIRSYTSGSFQGVTYASVDNAYTAAGLRNLETFYDASGNVLASQSFTANGGFVVTVGGVVALSKIVNADGSYVLHYTTPGTILGTAYTNSDNSHTAAGALDAQTFYDASGHVVATETYQPNGGYTITTNGVVREIKTGNADGSYVIETENVVGQTYTETFAATDHTGKWIATSTTLTNGANATIVYGAGQTLSDVAGVASISDGADTFQLGPDTHGTLNITGAANATLAFGTGDGTQIITGFATSGPGADVLSFSSNVFADYAHLMNATRPQGNDLLITLDASDTLLLKNVSMANFSSSNTKFT
jgi:VCBS repeat-containing protein